MPAELRQKVTRMLSARIGSVLHGSGAAAGKEEEEALAVQLEQAILEHTRSHGRGSSADAQLRMYKVTSRSVACPDNLCARLPKGDSVVHALINGKVSAANVVAVAHHGNADALTCSTGEVAAADGSGSLILLANDLVPKLWSTAVAGDVDACCRLLDMSARSEQARLLNFPYPHQGGKTPLHGAAMHGHVNLLHQLLERGSEVNARDRFSSATPLHHAAAQGHAEVITALLEGGADPQQRNGRGQTARDVCLAAMSALVSEHLALAGPPGSQEGKGSARTRMQIANHSRNAGRRAQRYARCEDRFDAHTELCARHLLRRYQLLAWAVGCHTTCYYADSHARTDTDARAWSVSIVSSDVQELVTVALCGVDLPGRAAIARDATERARAAVRSEDAAKRRKV
eukprot:COSAG02_NODE_161_length_32629_cov_10.363142_30_plen_401_part_00